MPEISSILIIFQFIILIFSIVIHEVSHGLVANYLGDPTAKYLGRLTLNPLKHLDPFGSFILPLLLYLGTGGRFVLGWAKPVPYNPAYLKNIRWGSALIALAGPFSNIILTLVFSLFWQTGLHFSLIPLIILINLFLAIFNLVPIPPLDGSKILFALLPPGWNQIQTFLEQYGIFILIIFIFFAIDLIAPLVFWLFRLLTGLSF